MGQNGRFFSPWPWNSMDDLKKRHLFSATSSFVHNSVAICDFKSELRSGNAQIGGKICFGLCDLILWHITLTFCLDITFINGNYSWNFMMVRWLEYNEKGLSNFKKTARHAMPFVRRKPCGRYMVNIYYRETTLRLRVFWSLRSLQTCHE